MRGKGIVVYLVLMTAVIVFSAKCGYCQSKDTLDFSFKTFTEPVDAYYWHRLGLDGIEVDTGSIAVDVRFKSPVSFYDATFESTADFIQADFNSTASFRLTVFTTYTELGYTSFDSTADFFRTSFNSAVSFSNADFKSIAYFKAANFHSWANFKRASFDSAVNFDYAQFGSFIDFQGANFGGRVFFKFNTLPDTLDMRSITQIAYPINMTFSQKPQNSGNCKIALTKSDVSKIWINMELFQLWFPVDTMLNHFIINEDTIIKIAKIDSASYDDQLAVYEGLLKQFDDRGLKQSYEILDKEYRNFINKHKGGIYVGIDWFQRYWWDYGYKPELIFMWTGIGWLLFSLINLFFYRRLNEDVYAVSFLGARRRPVLASPRTWIRYFLQTLTYTAVIFFGLKMSIEKFQKGVIKSHPLLFSYLMAVYVSGLICIGFIVNIIFTR